MNTDLSKFFAGVAQARVELSEREARQQAEAHQKEGEKQARRKELMRRAKPTMDLVEDLYRLAKPDQNGVVFTCLVDEEKEENEAGLHSLTVYAGFTTPEEGQSAVPQFIVPEFLHNHYQTPPAEGDPFVMIKFVSPNTQRQTFTYVYPSVYFNYEDNSGFEEFRKNLQKLWAKECAFVPGVSDILRIEP